jgi:hypothetical protein
MELGFFELLQFGEEGFGVGWPRWEWVCSHLEGVLVLSEKVS